MEHEKIVSVINPLIEVCYDGEEGYKTAAQKVDNQELKELFEEFAAQRGRFAMELSNIVVHELGKPEKGGSLTGTVRKGWINVKGMITGGDEHAILEVCESAEDDAIKAYDKALGEPLPDTTHLVIQRQYRDIKSAHDRIRALRDTYEKP